MIVLPNAIALGFEPNVLTIGYGQLRRVANHAAEYSATLVGVNFHKIVQFDLAVFVSPHKRHSCSEGLTLHMPEIPKAINFLQKIVFQPGF